MFYLLRKHQENTKHFTFKIFFAAKGAGNMISQHVQITSHVKATVILSRVMLFARVEISCFRAKANLLFHWLLYDKF